MHRLLTASVLAVCAVSAQAHYGMIIPDNAMLSQEEGRSVTLSLSFSHPWERDGMVLDTPVSLTVTHDGTTTDLTGGLQATEIMGAPGFTLEAPLARPGAHVFAMEPQPYWEPEEDAFITHYTKVVVPAYGDDDGWDTELGLKTEIVPLSKPFGLWAGNVFQGIVKLDGAAVPYAEVEVEHFNLGDATAPSDLMITQTVKADANGVFTYAAPVDGWWGFAALNTAEDPMMFEDQPKDHELGAVIWVHFEAWGAR